MRAGVVWDNHSNIPQAPVKRLAARLVELANPPRQADPLDTVLLGVCTGSVACGAALKMQLVAFEKSRGQEAVPVVVVLDGNYHGTDMITQNLRGMWGRFVRNIQVVPVQPNDKQELESVFRTHRRNVAAFWAEPVMMNREAVAVEAEYLQLARRLCDENDAPMCLDEIQTGFWRPEMFDCRALGIAPDMLICGKGMTAGFHPLAAVVYKRRYDVLEQYDAISTNGQSALPALVALANMALIESSAGAINAAAGHYRAAMTELAGRHGGLLEGVRGRGHMVGLKFRRREDALEFHRRAVADGLWVRAHAYHAGHSTVLTKLGLLADAGVVDFLAQRFGRLLENL
jgi:adenosylmethionine-8-amino-7-oxononanoate aminotransferase